MGQLAAASFASSSGVNIVHGLHAHGLPGARGVDQVSLSVQLKKSPQLRSFCPPLRLFCFCGFFFHAGTGAPLTHPFLSFIGKISCCFC
jgi:hypothetical protein